MSVSLLVSAAPARACAALSMVWASNAGTRRADHRGVRTWGAPDRTERARVGRAAPRDRTAPTAHAMATTTKLARLRRITSQQSARDPVARVVPGMGEHHERRGPAGVAH